MHVTASSYFVHSPWKILVGSREMAESRFIHGFRPPARFRALPFPVAKDRGQQGCAALSYLSSPTAAPADQLISGFGVRVPGGAQSLQVRLGARRD